MFSAFLALLLWELAYADPPYSSCPNTSADYIDGSPFKNNLDELLISLSSKASSSKFYNTSTGNDTDRVYGVHMCLDYVTNENCGKCIATATKDILKLCPYTREAVVWEELCQLRYSNQNFFGQVNLTGNKHQYNPMNLSQPLQFKYRSVVKETLNNLTTEAAAFNLSAKLRYATGEVDFEDKTIYALVQCTRDLSGDGCNSCLERAIADHAWRWYFLLPACLVLRTKRLGNVRCLSPSLLYKFYIQFYKTQDFPYIKLSSIQAATDNFSDSNKLGEGGFGPVYKGLLSDGKEVAVKRLSFGSEQGSEEFINEVLLIMKLQRKNLVKLLGFCVEGDERLLVYEFMPNNSLDVFLFDPEKRSQLDWKTYGNIIVGIAKGLLYLHEDSRLKIIHRDLKPSNVLLDHEMVAKISDFGMARIFVENQNTANTRRVVGTYGYMAPEYAMEGLFSVKSDVFSFGVILLEIISGKKNSSFYLTEYAHTLLAYAWRLWNEGKEMKFVEPVLMESCLTTQQIKKCMHIGLLCVQEDPADRPTMSSVVVLLGDESILPLPKPKQPALAMGRIVQQIADPFPVTNPSVNGLTVSSLSPR
ncbi:hypothetical protein I3760_09G082300 [Carya illinoinensis]|nr:hypothetical protein I3760_09G082300 [Carya illinoinensis]